MTLGELFAGLSVNALTQGPWRAVEVRELTLDPLELSPELCALMIARSMWYRDTHEELSSAIERGARALLVSRPPPADLISSAERAGLPVLCVAEEDPTLGLISDRFYREPTSRLKVYGVTGTNGKTSTVSYLAELLEAAGERVAVMGTVEYRFESQRLSAPNTTPDALVIHRFARDALDLGATALALEVSSHALTLQRVARVAFDAVGFTNLSRDHLDFHGTMEEYREAKGALFGAWLEASIERGKRPTAVAFAGPEGEAMLSRAPAAAQRVMAAVELWGEGAQQGAQPDALAALSCVVKMSAAPSATEMQLSALLPSGASLMERAVPLIGDYHPSNLAVALGMLWGTHQETPVSLERAWAKLSSTRGVSGRMELAWSDEAAERGRVALVDYAHTPEAVTRALEALRAVHRGAIYTVLGCGGDRDRGKRPLMARAALALSERLYLTSDNPRSEDPQQILRDAQEGLSRVELERTRCDADRREVISRAWRELPAGGALLIAGKGHESYQELALEGQKRRFALSDAEALRAAALAERRGLSSPLELPYSESLRLGAPCTAFDVLYEAGSREAGLSLALKLEVEPPPVAQPGELSLSCRSIDEALAGILTGLCPLHHKLTVSCADEALLRELAALIDLELRRATLAHRGPRALEADREEGALLLYEAEGAQLTRRGWAVGGVSSAYIPTLAR